MALDPLLGEVQYATRGFARGLRGGIFTASIPEAVRTASKDSVNCPARSRIRKRKLAAVAEVQREIADLLGSPRPVRMGGDPEDVDIARAYFDDEEAVQALERHRAVT